MSVIQPQKPFVSIGGNKLELAINKLKIECSNLTFIDVGASTGGFTDCLLRRNAKKIYCVDVGENLLDEQISSNEKVVVMDKTNARFLTRDMFEDEVDGIVVDCSFISLEFILPPLVNLLNETGFILALIKPQFELKERVKIKNGVLKNNKERLLVLKRLYAFAIAQGLIPQAMVCTTVDKNKNLEYIFYLKKQGEITDFDKIIVE